MIEGKAESAPVLVSRSLARLYEYWSGRRRGRDLPSRADIDPLDFPYVLGNVVLVDVLRDPLSFRYRLIGVNLVQRDGWDLTGKTVDEIPEPEYRRHIRGVFEKIVAERRPVSGMRDLFVDGRVRRYEALSLPLSNDGRSVTMILAATEYVGA
jgi:hypothetical protein